MIKDMESLVNLVWIPEEGDFCHDRLRNKYGILKKRLGVLGNTRLEAWEVEILGGVEESVFYIDPGEGQEITDLSSNSGTVLLEKNSRWIDQAIAAYITVADMQQKAPDGKIDNDLYYWATEVGRALDRFSSAGCPGRQ